MGLRLRRHLQRGRRVRAVPAREDRPAVRARDDRDGSGRRLPAARRHLSARAMRFRPRTLRGRITLLLALVTLGLAILVGVAVDVEYRSSLHSALDESLTNR